MGNGYHGLVTVGSDIGNGCVPCGGRGWTWVDWWTWWTANMASVRVYTLLYLRRVWSIKSAITVDQKPRTIAMTSQPLELSVDIPGLEIPGHYLSIVPSPDVDIPISRFRFYVLQEQKATLVFPPAETLFSTSLPSGTYNLSNLTKHPIPSAKSLRSLQIYLRNLPDATQLSLQSIRNPVNHDEFLPLWVLTVWDKVSSLINSRNQWVQSCLWAERLKSTHREGTQRAFTHFGILGWGSQLSLYGLRGITNLSLTQFLSNDRVNDEAIDLMARFLSCSPALPTRILVFDLRLSKFLSTIHSRDALGHPSPPHIQEFETQLAQANAFYFPLFHAKFEHWIAFKVDMCRREVAYGLFFIG